MTKFSKECFPSDFAMSGLETGDTLMEDIGHT